MMPKWTFAVIAFIFLVSASEEERLKVDINLFELVYEDACIETANATWGFLKNPTNQTLQTWVNSFLGLSTKRRVILNLLLHFSNNRNQSNIEIRDFKIN